MFEHIEKLAWLVLLLPLAVLAIITAFTRPNPRVSAQLSISAIIGSFIAATILFCRLSASGADSLPPVRFLWLWVGDFAVDIGLRLDRLSLGMALVVTGVGGLIHIYSAGYMQGDRAYSRYFACLSLFTFSMLGIVLSDNFVMMFIFWELVGISSYLLIGFWYEREAAADACKKAFLCNRVGDFGFLLGILMVWATLGRHLNFGELEDYLKTNGSGSLGTAATAAGLLIFCGAVGKSAQFPLHVWLPDAMEGPTPVSALIHAATMVAAGVYMLCRVFFLLDVPGSQALEVVAWTGGFTALLAAVIAVQQNDIKRILAYSTLSQLGYMVMAVGVSGGMTGGPAAMYHLTTHAFFKALLFLGAGSIILALHHEQNIWKMGALKKKMPVTYWTFMAGAVALCGVPPLSGFYSKDSILAQALKSHHVALFILGVVVALLTTFYMFRLAFVVFGGVEKSDAVHHAHESPRIMIWPLRILALFSVIGGAMGIESLYGEAVRAGSCRRRRDCRPLAGTVQCVAVGSVVWFVRGRHRLFDGLHDVSRRVRRPAARAPGLVRRAMRNRFYFDELYERVVIRCTQEAAARIADWFDRWIIAGAVRFTHGGTELLGRALRLLQSGSLQTHAFLLVLGVAILLYCVLER